MPAYLTLSVDLTNLDAESVASACLEQGALAITYSDAGDAPILEPAPGEFRLWPQTRLQAVFDASLFSPQALRDLANALNIEPNRLQLQALADRVWEREWLKDFHAMKFGRRLWVAPAHDEVTAPDAVIVHLDPGLAFGTGTHPTTAMCLEWLDVNLRGGERVVDYGCGSGILAIAALKLGAEHASAFDIDPQALIATEDNATRNGVAERLSIVRHAAALDDAEADVVLANILAGPLQALAPRLIAMLRPGGHLVLAGLLSAQAAELQQTYCPRVDLAVTATRAEWACLSGTLHALPGARQAGGSG